MLPGKRGIEIDKHVLLYLILAAAVIVVLTVIFRNIFSGIFG
jgi:hypothetical protein